MMQKEYSLWRLPRYMLLRGEGGWRTVLQLLLECKNTMKSRVMASKPRSIGPANNAYLSRQNHQTRAHMPMKLADLHQRRQRSYVLVKVPEVQSKCGSWLTSMRGCIFRRRHGIHRRRRSRHWHHGHLHAATSAEDKALKHRRNLRTTKQNTSDDSKTRQTTAKHVRRQQNTSDDSKTRQTTAKRVLDGDTQQVLQNTMRRSLSTISYPQHKRCGDSTSEMTKSRLKLLAPNPKG
jgi:hypothetical protein